MRMTSWTEHRAYDLRYDAVMARLIWFDDRCQPHWLVIDGTGRGYRDRREAALETIMKHIEADEPAGEISDASQE